MELRIKNEKLKIELFPIFVSGMFPGQGLIFNSSFFIFNL